MDKKSLLSTLNEKMQKTIQILEYELKGLRGGRASANFLDALTVEAYQNKTPINQVATINVADAKTITIQVWDKSLVKAVEKCIVEANLGVNPISEGQNIKIVLPPLSEERRKEFIKLACKYGENTKVSIRNIRRDGTESIKKMEKEHKISKDEQLNLNNEVQKLTDKFIAKVESQISHKEKEILTI